MLQVVAFRLNRSVHLCKNYMLSLSVVDVLRLFCYISSEFSMCKVNLLLAFLQCSIVCFAYTLLVLYTRLFCSLLLTFVFSFVVSSIYCDMDGGPVKLTLHDVSF